MRQLALTAAVALLALVAAVSADEPKKVWSIDLETPQLVMNPLIAALDDLVLIPTNTTLFARKLSDGSAIWNFTVPGNATGGYVALDKTSVYFGTDQKVHQLHRDSGELGWSFDLPAGRTQPLVHARVDLGNNGILFVTTWTTPIIALHAYNGSVKYVGDSRFAAQMHSHPVGDHVYYYAFNASNVGHVVCAFADTGKVLWAIGDGTINNFVMGTVRHRLSVILLRVIDNVTMRLDAVDAWDRNADKAPLLWNRTFGAVQSYLDYYVMDSGLYVGTSMTNMDTNDDVFAVDLDDASIRWKGKTGFDTLLAADAAVFGFGTSTGTQAFDAYSGKGLWNSTLSAVNNGAAGDNKVVFGTATQIVALRIRDEW